ncbi:nitrile hydratase accessory protein [Epidermidibacterium keratini]|uniref:Nitrile hydratase accessory protein n=1 Tax=Epidermidibacterium keratini TaxID=1891644 RepID=A0A7L4YK37_9ACTN|nr:nitrile hydratase accessory protein [Epidermidibacterium keratini]QHB99168.1 nitrile hydratase accessory protein [Epidermidibacterium keratini]
MAESTTQQTASRAEALAAIVAACGDELPLPPSGEESVFAEPWQAQVFATTVALHERGLFTWPQWAQALGNRVAQTNDATGADYYLRWSEALVDVLAETGTLEREQLADLEKAWHDAAARTPHGQPISL